MTGDLVLSKECQRLANISRLTMLDMAEICRETMHWGGSLSSMEIFAVLYKAVLRENDIFILSKGHAGPGYYAVLYNVGKISHEILMTYQQNGSDLAELVESNSKLGFVSSGGSLGINLSYASGIALLVKKTGVDKQVYIEVGDGEIDEGSVWESIMFASQQKLDNLTMIIDINHLQSDGNTKNIIGWDNLKNQLTSFGWVVHTVNGHECLDIMNALLAENKENRPKAIIATTIKGKGISFMEDDNSWHDRKLRKKELQLARKEVRILVGNGE